MRKVIVIIVVIVVLAIAGWLVFGNNSKTSSPSNATPANNSNQNSQNNTNNNTQSASTNSVDIANMAFSPANITIKKGTKVTWTNKDTIGHTVTETDSKTGPNSSTLDQNASYSFTYNQTGTFNYHCSIHPEMTGTVTVTD